MMKRIAAVAAIGLVAQNVANGDTPGYQPRDLKPFTFQASLDARPDRAKQLLDQASLPDRPLRVAAPHDATSRRVADYVVRALGAVDATARRLHDTDRSAWWILIGLIPLIGAIVLLVFYLLPGTTGPNKFGADPKQTHKDAAETFA